MPQSNSIREVCNFAATPSFEWLNRDRARRVAILEGIAAGLDARRDEVLSLCSEETALTVEELAPEFARMTGTLRMFAGVVREGSWVRAAIDPPAESPRRSIGPNHDVRRMLVPLGAVAVFGASNFPLAYGVCGGDTASALAAGCTVVVKEHPAHIRTGRLIFEIARKVIVENGAPEQYPGFVMGYIQNEDPTDYSVAQELVQNEFIQAVGFTGSQGGGKALIKLSQERERPIPVFAEMGSLNRVVICRHALEHRGPAIASELAASILARHGQQCTKPGLIALERASDAGARFVAELARLLDAGPARKMLSERVTDEYVHHCRRLNQIPLVTRVTRRPDPELLVNGERHTAPMLFAAMDEVRGNLDAVQMFTPEDRGYFLNDEIFGPAAVVFGSDGWENLFYSESALVTAVYADPEDVAEMLDEDAADWPARLEFPIRFALSGTGRFTFNAVPTGVRVAHGMVHGGPYPSTNRPDTTAVGPFAIERWCRPVCFQNCPQELLPLELQDANPLGIMRIVNGE